MCKAPASTKGYAHAGIPSWQRGWGLCNDNAFGLAASVYTARALGVPPPCVLQNDYSILNRRIEENGVSEASSPMMENLGFMAYDGGDLQRKGRTLQALTLSCACALVEQSSRGAS